MPTFGQSVIGSLNQAIRDWESEVEGKAAELINNGVPPWVAMERAAEIVRMRRQEQAVARRIREK